MLRGVGSVVVRSVGSEYLALRVNLRYVDADCLIDVLHRSSMSDALEGNAGVLEMPRMIERADLDRSKCIDAYELRNACV